MAHRTSCLVSRATWRARSGGLRRCCPAGPACCGSWSRRPTRWQGDSAPTGARRSPKSPRWCGKRSIIGGGRASVGADGGQPFASLCLGSRSDPFALRFSHGRCLGAMPRPSPLLGDRSIWDNEPQRCQERGHCWLTRLINLNRPIRWIRSFASSGVAQVSDVDLAPNRPAVVLLSKKGYIKRVRPETFSAQRRGGRGKAGANLQKDDEIGERRGGPPPGLATSCFSGLASG